MLIFVSPIIDHLMIDFDENKDPYTIIIEIIVQLFIIGFLLYILFVSHKMKFMKTKLNINEYYKILIDLVFTIVFIGTQKNLVNKLNHITNIHPIRNIFINL